jgi:acetyl esterase/lipase
LGIDPDKVVAMGESSGAHLAALAGTLPNGPVNREGANPALSGPDPSGISARVQAVVDFYGPTDLLNEYRDRPAARPYLRSVLGGSADQVPGRYVAASPVSHVSRDDPPTFIIQGTADKIIPTSQSTELADALRAAGVSVQLTFLPGITHGFRLRIGGYSLVPSVLAFLDSALA